MKRVTIEDIAKAAGVTKGAVSMAINGYDRIPQLTKDRIFGIIKKMGYFPHESAQALARGKAMAISFIATRFAAPFISSILYSFEQRAYDLNRYVHGIVPYSTHDNDAEKEDVLKRVLEEKKAEAVVLLTMKPGREILDRYNKAKIPVILIENEMKGAHSVCVDNYSGASAATEYLIKKGRKNICIISGQSIDNARNTRNMPGFERMRGFLDTMDKYGLKVSENKIEMVERYSFEDGREALEKFLKNKAKPDAIFCAAGDIVAVGVIEKARQFGLKIPGDIAVIGFDDSVFAGTLNPPLTTVRQPVTELGQMAFDIALDAIDGKLKSEKKIRITPELIIRKSA